MPSPILDSLPAIHTTVIGFGGAFFSAFALYAYQKLREAKDQLEKFLKDAKELATPTDLIGMQTDLLLENGELNWDGKAIVILHKSTWLFPSRKQEDALLNWQPQLSDDQVTSSCKSLCNVLYWTFVSYPFPGRPIVHIQGITEKMEERKKEPFDLDRLREVERRINFLCWLWETNSQSILELANQSTIAERRLAEQREKVAFEAHLTQLPPPTDQGEEKKLRERIWNDFHQPRITNSADYTRIVADYFHRVVLYKEKLLPILGESARTLDLYNKQFQVKKLSIGMIRITLFILIFGVFLPPVMQGVKSDFGICWPPAVEYIILTLTAMPYFWVCLWLYRKIQSSGFL